MKKSELIKKIKGLKLYKKGAIVTNLVTNRKQYLDKYALSMYHYLTSIYKSTDDTYLVDVEEWFQLHYRNEYYNLIDANIKHKFSHILKVDGALIFFPLLMDGLI